MPVRVRRTERTVVAAILAALVLLTSPGRPAPAATAPSDPSSPAPGKLVLVLDASGSMAEPAGGRQSRIEAARTALGEVVDALPDDQEVALRVFGATVEYADQPGACEDSQRVVDLATDNRDALRDAVAAYRPFGETPTGHALREAGRDLGDSGPRSIVLVSDGEPTCAPDPCRVARELAGDGIDVRIDVVGLSVTGAARDALECIADAGHGTYYDADDADAIVDSLTASAARAARPFDFSGTPVRGTPDPAAAPVIGAGQWLDRMPDDGKLHYRLPRTVPGSTLHVGIATRSRPDATVASSRLSILPADGGGSCFSDTGVGVVLGMRDPILFVGGSSGRDDDPQDPCNADDELVVEVGHATAAGEPLAGQPVEIAVYEEPPLSDSASAPAGVPLLPRGAWEPMEPAATATAVVPGTSLASAPLVGDGSWTADIQPGEAQVFAVPVDWGQDVQFQLDTRLTRDAAEAAAVGSELSLTPVGPVRDVSAVDYYAAEPADWTATALGNLPAGTPFRIGARTQPIAYRHRFETGSDAGASLAGVRYVRVAYNVRGDDANLAYTLTVRTNGPAGRGAPTYDESAALVVPAPGSRLVGTTVETVDTQTEQSSEAPEQDSGDATAPKTAEGSGGTGMTVAVAGGIVLLAAGLLLIAVRRRRAAR
jgi:Ca-activated chloride channel family protein